MADRANADQDPAIDQVPPVVLRRDQTIYPLGSASYIISGKPHSMMLTAFHLFTEMERIDAGPSRRASSIPPDFLPDPKTERRLERSFMHVIREVGGGGRLRRIGLARGNPHGDVAIAQLVEEGDLDPPRRVSIDTSIPQVGTPIFAVGFSKMDPVALGPNGTFVISWERSIKAGHITAVHPDGAGGLGLCRWPCFETDILVEHGMSGGPIFDRRRPTLTAIGIVSSGWHEAAVGSMLWPIGALSVETRAAGETTVLSLIEEGLIDDVGLLHKRMEMTPTGMKVRTR